MNKNIKKLLRLSGILAAIGGAAVLICVILSAVGINGFSQNYEGNPYIRMLEKWGIHFWPENSGAEYIGDEELEASAETNAVSVPMDDVSSMQLELKKCEMQMLVTDEKNISVQILNKSEKDVTIQKKNDTLCIKDQRKNTDKEHVKMIITIPKNKEFEHLDMQIGAGSIECEQVSAQEFDLQAGACEVKIDKCQIAKTAHVQGGVGEIKMGMVGSKEDYNFEVETGVGDITLYDQKYSSLGKTVTIDNHSDRTLSFECGVGEIEIYQVNEI